MNAKNIAIGIGGILVLGIAGFAAAVSMQPATLEVDRSVVVDATPADVFPLANDFTHFNSWDPWSPKDPEQVTTVSDPPAGVGARMEWQGPTNGSGNMVITDSVDNERVVEDLEFIEPFPSKAVVTLTFAPTDGGTEVHWKMHSPNDLMGKMAGLFMDMQGMLDADFDAGLAKLKTVGEARAAERIAQEEAAAAKAAEEAAAAEVALGGAGEVEPTAE